MQSTETSCPPVGHLKLSLRILAGYFALMGICFAQVQPKPGPEHKRLEVAVGKWNYQGSGEATPFGPAGKFKGQTVNRMVLNGFFLESRGQDTGESGYVFQAIDLRGYNPVTKTYFARGFENDGRETSSTVAVSGNTWTLTGLRTDAEGKLYQTRSIETYSSNGKSSTFVAEYSGDEGRTWKPLWKGTMKRVGR